MRIIIAEKEDRVRKGIVTKLPEGAEVLEFTNWSCLEKQLAQSNGYKAIVLGEKLGDITGVEAIRRVRERKPDVQILFYGNSTRLKSALDAGANKVYAKGDDNDAKELKTYLKELFIEA
jgi:DNA-binding response OmpR family regulator